METIAKIIKIVKKVLGRHDGPASGLLPKVEISTLFDARDFQLNFLEPRTSDGNVSGFELFALNSLVRKHSPGALFEFGTFKGRTTLNLAANSTPEARIYTLDLPHSKLQSLQYNLEQIEKKYVEKPVSGEVFSQRPEALKITQLFGDSAKFDYTPFFNQIDFVFVDASHAYDYVVNDSQIALKLLRNGRGVILWHDYGCPHWWPGVTRALDELQKNSKPFENLVQIEGTSLACLIKN
jgi:predicted O-methyltransferase YrrM